MIKVSPFPGTRSTQLQVPMQPKLKRRDVIGTIKTYASKKMDTLAGAKRLRASNILAIPHHVTCTHNLQSLTTRLIESDDVEASVVSFDERGDSGHSIGERPILGILDLETSDLEGLASLAAVTSEASRHVYIVVSVHDFVGLVEVLTGPVVVATESPERIAPLHIGAIIWKHEVRFELVGRMKPTYKRCQLRDRCGNQPRLRRRGPRRQQRARV